MAPDTFEALVRRQLTERDKRRRARLGDALAYAEADQLCVAAIMEAAGYPVGEDEAPVVRKARRARRVNEDRAFGDVPA